MTKIAIRVCSHLAYLETGSDTKAICFADSAMIMHVVPESAEVSSCGHRNISRVAVQCIWRRAGDGRTIIIYIQIANVQLVYIVGLAQARSNNIRGLNSWESVCATKALILRACGYIPFVHRRGVS